MVRAILGLLVLAPTLAVSAASLLDSFVDVQWETYRHTAPNFSVQYPYALHAATPSRPGEVFTAAGPTRVPSVSVTVLPRQAGMTLDQAAQAAAKQLAPNGTVKAPQPVDLGGVPGVAVAIEWSVPIGSGVDLRTLQVSAFDGDSWVIVTGTDGRVGETLDPQLLQAVTSLRFAP